MSAARSPGAPLTEDRANGQTAAAQHAPSEPAVTETRPEILVGAAFAGGFVLAKLLGRVRGR